MKELIIRSMQSVRKKIDPNNRKYCFELFGYDFILDEDFNMFLIEVNTNPCLEESSNILKCYLPRMIEDMLKITVDVVFPKFKKRKNPRRSTLTKSTQGKPSTVNNNEVLGEIAEEEFVPSDVEEQEFADNKANSESNPKDNEGSK